MGQKQNEPTTTLKGEINLQNVEVEDTIGNFTHNLGALVCSVFARCQEGGGAGRHAALVPIWPRGGGGMQARASVVWGGAAMSHPRFKTKSTNHPAVGGNVCQARARRATFLLTIPTSAPDLPSHGEAPQVDHVALHTFPPKHVA